MAWKKYCFLICLVNSFCCGLSQISDEEYALMPDLFDIENYDSCMLLKDKAFYCAIEYELKPINPQNPPKIWNTIKESSASELHYRHDILHRFICVPKTCPNVKTFNKTDPKLGKELNDCLDDIYKSQGFRGTLDVENCKGAGPIYEIDRVDWIIAIVFISYVGLVLILSGYDYLKSYDEQKYQAFKDSTGGKFVVALSIASNWRKLKFVPTGSDYERLKPVQGLRVYMSIMVIGVHSILSQVAIPIVNPKYYEDMNDSPDLFSNIPRRCVFILSFHFMMSSWMLITSLLARNDRNEALTLSFIVKSIIKRYIRFIFTIAIVVGFYATWFRHIPFGPFFDGVCDESERCRKNWWTNLLFIQNHYDCYYMCHIITWYLAVDMQYYIITLFLLYIIFRTKINIPFTVGILLIVNFIFAFWDHQRHGYLSTLSGKPEEIYRLLFNRKSQWHDHFASYHGNAAGYIAGLGFGYVYHKYKNQKIFTSLGRKVAWAIFSFGSLGLTLIVPQIYDVDATTTHSALWVATTRPLFSIGMGILILGLSEGLGGWVKDSLNWSPLYVLGKLSYCVYLCHTIFQNLRVGIMRSPGYISEYALVEVIASDVILSFIAALWLTLFFEMPSNELANHMFKTKKKVEGKKQN